MYEITGAGPESGAEVRYAADTVRQSSRQAYYLEVCGSRPPLQIISNSHWVQNAAGRLVACWTTTHSKYAAAKKPAKPVKTA